MSAIETPPPDKDEVSCRTCKFWDFTSHKDKDEAGVCRRLPPTPLTGRKESDVDGELAYVTWPLTAAFDWCGEWRYDNLPASEEEKA